MESMIHINSHDRPIAPRRDFKFKSSKKPSGLTVARVRDFTLLLKLIAEYDLWDEMEAELKSQGCTRFFISLKLMQTVGLALKEKVSIGDLPADSPAMYACDCTGDAVDNAGKAGAAGEAASKSGRDPSAIIPAGQSGVPDPGSEDKAQ